ncbi:MAG: LysR family transcriptional regulator [Candidatus Competibacterales bacterium]|nr:LysR family transcriptional regulator [Candidatus Competibacterales bacterium]
MDFENLQAFIMVARQGSFSSAAERLHLTQPAVSKRIATLEQQLDVRLFDRLGRQTMLTEAGHTLLPRARRILAEIEDSRRALNNLNGDVAGTLTLATSHHIGLHRLPPLLRAFTQRYPEVRLDLHFTDSELACEAVGRGELELAIVTLPQSAPSALRCRVVWSDPLAVVAAPDHALVQSGLLIPTQLQDWPAVLPGESTYTRRLIEQFFDRYDLTLEAAFATNYLETIKMLVSVGLGWSVLPRSMLDEGLRELRIKGFDLCRELGVVRHAGHTLSNAARALLELLPA